MMVNVGNLVVSLALIIMIGIPLFFLLKKLWRGEEEPIQRRFSRRATTPANEYNDSLDNIALRREVIGIVLPKYIKEKHHCCQKKDVEKGEGGEDGDEDEEDECAICLCPMEVGDTIVTTSTCGHSFHADCIEKWVSREDECPVCRTKMWDNATFQKVAKATKAANSHAYFEA